MAAKSSSSLRLDDFVSAVHSDPANVEPTVLLAGYLGKSPEEGNVRVYTDPSLSSWLEVPEAEVIHSRPIADSPLGGSQLWVRASAQIKPGAAGAPAAPAGGEGGDKAAVGSDTGVFNPMATIHPTSWTQFCPTGVGCLPTIPCLPPSIGCPQGGALQGGPTGWYTCVCPVGPTGTQGCGQGGPGAIGPTGWHTCACPATQIGCPNTVSCPPAAFAATPGPLTWAQCPTTTCAEAVGPTGTQGCTQPPHCVPNSVVPACFTIGGCGGGAGMAAVGPTGTQGCTQPGHCVGQTGWHTCACPIGPTGTQGCGMEAAAAWPTNPTASTRCFICPPFDTTALAGGAQAAFVGQQSTAATLCTQIGCQPRQSTAATLCTHYGCPPGGGGPVITLVTVFGCPHPSWVDACPTRLCGITISGPCLPYTLGGCFPGGRQF